MGHKEPDKCEEYLHIDRNNWPKKEIEVIRSKNKIYAREVKYMDRNEILIDDIDPMPHGIEDIATFKAALEDKNVFLLQIQDKNVKTSKEVNRLLKTKSSASLNDGMMFKTNNEYEDKMKIVVGMPLLHFVRVQPTTETLNTTDSNKKVNIYNQLF